MSVIVPIQINQGAPAYQMEISRAVEGENGIHRYTYMLYDDKLIPMHHGIVYHNYRLPAWALVAKCFADLEKRL